MEREITQPVDIAHPDGRLCRDAVGWARHPIHRTAFGAGVPRVARWNYWCLANRECALTLLFADVGYAGIVLVSFADYAVPSPVERLYVRPGGLPFPMPDTPRGDVSIDTRRLALAMRAVGDEEMRVEGHARTLLGKRLAIDLVVMRPPAHETINVLVPWDETRFQFTSKQQALPVRGTVRLDAREYRFTEANDSFACLDFGRGRWPRGIEWNWAFASGRCGARTIGLNFGGTWTDGTGVTENGVVIDGRLHKVSDDVEFVFDRRAFMNPWRVRSRGSSRVDLRFSPMRQRSVNVPLGLAGVRLAQMMGTFSGTFEADGGERIEIADLVGLAEWLRARW
jgi:hypothetical protein